MKVDITRFIDKIPELFAPSIHDGQAFFAYLDEDTNIFTVQGDNLFSSAGQEDIERISVKLATLITQVNGIQDDCTEISGIKTQIASLQSDVTYLSQEISSSAGQSSSTSITVVDDIVYGYYDSEAASPLSIANLKAMRGRPYITNDDDYGPYLYLKLSSDDLAYELLRYEEINTYNKVLTYAGFGDGKIHTYDNSTLSSVPLNNGDFFFNKTDNSLYTYNATNHKFLKVGGKRHYVVDAIFDYVGQTIPNDLYHEGTLFICIDTEDDEVKITPHLLVPAKYNGSSYFEHALLTDTISCFANIRSDLNDGGAVYSVTGYDDNLIRVIHDLCDGDSIFNKQDGCTYVYSDNGTSKSFVKVSEPEAIPPVLGFAHIGCDPSAAFPEPVVGDSYIFFQPDSGEANYTGYVMKYTAKSEWATDPYDYDNSRLENGERYASLDNHKIYSFGGWGHSSIPMEIPVGVPFLNKADNSLYVFDGTQFIKTGNS